MHVVVRLRAIPTAIQAAVTNSLQAFESAVPKCAMASLTHRSKVPPALDGCAVWYIAGTQTE